MDAFSTLGFPPTFNLDVTALEQKYFALQRQYHPDRFAGKSPEERQKALLHSMMVNEAYQMLKSPLTRAQELLQLQGIIVGTEKDTVKPSQQLLMETLEWREALSEAQDNASVQSIDTTARAAKEDCLAGLNQLFAAGDFTGAAQATLRLGYLDKLLDECRQRLKVFAA